MLHGMHPIASPKASKMRGMSTFRPMAKGITKQRIATPLSAPFRASFQYFMVLSSVITVRLDY